MIEVLKQALEALQKAGGTCFDEFSHREMMSQPDHFMNQSITSLRQAIAELESQELKQVTVKDFVHIVEGKEDLIGRPVYFAQWPNGNAHPPQRTWVGLTDDDKVLIKHDANFNQFMTAGEYADRVQQLTEARLKDKNT